ncbi:hypothetical protein ACOACO_00865 [Nocardioides sp. CPCC 205120]|uniref:hypothetical protein n=1 Tax=Nocardioides sp. CPCC 205120 TaxID=3406462 RepID=UPI003B509518
MFVHHCTACRKHQLTFDSQFTAVRAVEGGYEATFTCWCGAEQTHLSEGARAARLALAA